DLGMKTVQWLFAVSVMLFVIGIGFIIAGERTRQTTKPQDSAPAAAKPIASIKQIMSTVTLPSATAVFNAVGETVSLAGTESIAPKNDQEWAVLAGHAATLAESGNLLTAEGRALDRGEW